MLFQGHTYTVERSTENQLIVTDADTDVVGIITLDHNMECASVLAFYEDGSEESYSLSYFEVCDMSDDDLGRVVVTYASC